MKNVTHTAICTVVVTLIIIILVGFFLPDENKPTASWERRKVAARKVANKEKVEELVKIVDHNWRKDPTWAGDRGTIKWNVQVKNTSNKYVENVQVEFTTYEAGGRLISTTFTFVSAIPPGGMRAESSYADLYGTEARAEVRIIKVYFAH